MIDARDVYRKVTRKIYDFSLSEEAVTRLMTIATYSSAGWSGFSWHKEVGNCHFIKSENYGAARRFANLSLNMSQRSIHRWACSFNKIGVWSALATSSCRASCPAN